MHAGCSKYSGDGRLRTRMIKEFYLVCNVGAILEDPSILNLEGVSVHAGVQAGGQVGVLSIEVTGD